MIYKGACICQAITYQIDLPPTEPTPKIILCHCNECKRYSGTGFSSNIILPAATLTFTKGTPKEFFSQADTGSKITRKFCGDCGCTLSSGSARFSENIVVKSGTLDDGYRELITEVMGEVYCKRRDKWVDRIGGEGVPRADEMLH